MTSAYSHDNIFAKIIRGEIPSHKIYEDDDAFAFMDVMPQGKGHCLVIPKQGSRNIFDADAQVLAKLVTATQKIAIAVKKAFDADGVTIMQFNEPAAGQTVFHLHFHVIPRFEGIALTGHSGKMEDQDILSENCKKIVASL